MNAQSQGALTGLALFDPVGSAPVGAGLLTRLDCGDVEGVKEARHRLRACVTEADYANWAATWGENLCARADDFAGADAGDASALEQAEEEATALEKTLEALQGAVRQAVSKLDDAAEAPSKDFAAAVEAVSALLENAL